MTWGILVLALRGAAAVGVLTALAPGIPSTVRTALAVVVGTWSAWLVATADPSLAQLPDDTLAVALVAAREVAIGATLGVVAALPLMAASAAGLFVDVAARAKRGPYGPMFGILAAAVFVGVDGHVVALRAIVDSYGSAPPLLGRDSSALHALVALLPAALHLAAPWLVTAAVVEIAVGAGTRVAGRVGLHVPLSAATPAALAMMTATLTSLLAVAVARLSGA